MLSLPGNEDPDTAVRETDTDAAVARLSAAQKQYVQDPFIKHLVPRAHLQPPRPPLINIGTFVRSTAIDQLIEQWLLLSDHAGQRCQIVSLGAGSDTRFWRIAVWALISFRACLYGQWSARQACIRTYSRTMWRLISRK
jgi:O-methyltransferase involved in polyketide biosynthesis